MNEWPTCSNISFYITGHHHFIQYWIFFPNDSYLVAVVEKLKFSYQIDFLLQGKEKFRGLFTLIAIVIMLGRYSWENLHMERKRISVLFWSNHYYQWWWLNKKKLYWHFDTTISLSQNSNNVVIYIVIIIISSNDHIISEKKIGGYKKRKIPLSIINQHPHPH